MNFNHEYANSFTITECNLEKLSIYKYLKWDSSFFISKWEEGIGTYSAGTIRRFNNIFHVQFCSGISLGLLRDLAAKGKTAQLHLSFRKCQGMPAYVLVDIDASFKTDQLELALER